MKTIRENTFETNSSSTHATTINFYAGRKPSFRPIVEEGETITLAVGWVDDEEDWVSKASMLATYVFLKQDDAALDNLEKVISEFAGCPVDVDIHKDVALLLIDKDYTFDEDVVDDYFSAFTHEYGNGSAESVMSVLDQVLATPDNILGFVFSQGTYSIYAYYDG